MAAREVAAREAVRPASARRPAWRRPPPVTRRRSSARSGRTITPLASLFLPCYSAAVPFLVTCAQCRQDVLEADLIGDDEECLLRDQLLAVHPNTVQPATLSWLLQHFVVTESAPPAA